MLFDVIKLQGRYLLKRDLKRLNIKCFDLALGTGEATNSSKSFIRPFPTAKIHELLERSGLSASWNLSIGA
ncbi:hypothetical protein GGR58DRAFT_474919 [Xylaria digitata]|nr:hypothetical protein GGR58DRAFT_474919 [Xylaria digitata]